MSDHAHADNFSSHVRRYLIVFFALIIGTAFTVWASYIDFGSRETNIVIALVIACVKAFLVAGFFMHLISERKMIYCVLAFTAFFFAALLYLTIWSMAHENGIHLSHVP